MKRLLPAVILTLLLALAALPAAAATLPSNSFAAAYQITHAATATIVSDKPDYHPGEVVTLKGSGWRAGEIVSMVMVVSPLTHNEVRLTAIADASGQFTESSYIVQQSDLNVTFNVTATGDKGSTAQTTFTDSDATDVTITGNGNVHDNQGNIINCTETNGTETGTCSKQYNSNTGTVILTATPSSGYVFSTWTNTGNTTCTPSGATCLFTTSGGNNTVTVVATFVAIVPPTISKAFNPTTLGVGATSVLTFTIANPNGGTSLTGVAVTDSLPGGVQVAATPGVTTSGCGAPTFTPAAGATTLTFSGGTIAANGTCTASVNVTPTTSGTKINTTGTVSSTNGGTGLTAAATLTVFGAATKLAFVTQPSNTAAGSSISPGVTVQVQDASGNPVTSGASSTASVTLAIGSNPGSGTLSGTVTANAVAGVATFSNLSINKTGNGYTLTAASSGLSGATSNTFNITPGAATQLVFSTQPSSSATGGTAFAQQPAITVLDANGNTVTGSSASITLAIGTNPGGGTLTCTTNPLSATSGLATFAGCRIDKTGVGYTLTAASSGLTGATSTAITITVGAAAKLAFAQQPTNTVAGGTIAPGVTVQVQDAGGNLVTTSSASIAMAIGTNPGGGTLTGTTPVNAVNGVATFSNLSINKTGTGYTLSSTSAGLTSAVSSTFNITPGAATQLAFGTQPGNTAAGSAIAPSPTVQILDANANVVTSSTAAITLAIGANPGSGTLSGTATVNAVAGVATFNGISINKTGTGYTVTAASSGLTGTTSGTFNITPGAATQLLFTTQPSSAANGGVAFAQQPAVTVEDANGNTVTSSSASITLAITAGTGTAGAAVSCTTNPLAASSGIATFAGCSINLAGNGYTLRASSGALTVGTSTAINVSAGTATKLSFSQQPTNTAAGSTIAPAVTVQVQDAGGNVVTSSSASISIAFGNNAGSGTLAGTTPVTAVNGVATFSNLSINKTANGYTLVAATSGLTSATSSAFNITPGAATQLAFTTQPSTTTTVATAFAQQPVVTVDDANGNTVTGSTASITLAIGVNPASGTLTCTTNPKNAAAGVDSFAGCQISAQGAGYTLTAASAGLATATSSAINIIGPPTIAKAFSPTTITAGGVATLTITLTNGNTATALTAVSVTDTFPSGVQVNSTPNVNNNCAATLTGAGSGSTSLSLTNVTIAPSSSCQVAIDLTATTGGSKVNTTGNVSSSNAGTGGTATATLSVSQAPSISSAAATTFNLSSPGTFQVTASGTPAPTFSESGALPAGVTFSAAGLLSGTPTVNGSFPITITATNGVAPDATQNFTLTVISQATFTEPFNTGHGWTYTQVNCTGTTCSESPTATTNCGPGGIGANCVSASNQAFFAAGSLTGYFHSPAGGSTYTWHSLGVPAGAIVTSVQGSWYDMVSGSCSGVTAGLQIFDSTGATELTSTPLVSLITVSADTGGAGATHTGSTVNIVSSQTAASGISLRFNLNPAGTTFFGTCNVFGDNINLVIAYSTSTGPARKGQLIIGWNRRADGTFGEPHVQNAVAR